MPIDPIFADRFHLIADIGSYEETETSADAAEKMRAFVADGGVYVSPDVAVTSGETSSSHGPVGLRMYRPRDPASVSRAALLWLHGGGFRAGGIDMPEAHTVSAELAQRTAAVVGSADSRLANDGVQFPIPLDDVSAPRRDVGGNRQSTTRFASRNRPGLHTCALV